MPRYILDTDILTLWQRNHPKVVAATRSYPPADVAITIISVEEQFQGRITRIRRTKQPDQLALAYLNFTTTVQTYRDIVVVPYPESAILRFEQLRKLKLRVGAMDLRIAAIALEAGATVVTKNHVDFARIPGLTIIDWSV